MKYAKAVCKNKKGTEMTQRIFDVTNPQDVKDLFDILPDKITKIVRNLNVFECYDKDENYIYSCQIFSINWRDKTEITRPADESNLIGCLCWFWDDNEHPRIAVMKRIAADTCYKYITTDGACYQNCRPVRRDEVKFVEDVE